MSKFIVHYFDNGVQKTDIVDDEEFYQLSKKTAVYIFSECDRDKDPTPRVFTKAECDAEVARLKRVMSKS